MEAAVVYEEVSRRPMSLLSRLLLLALLASAAIAVSGYAWYRTPVWAILFTTPSGAEVTLDGRSLGATDASTGELKIGSLKRGTHVLTCSEDGFNQTTRIINFGFFSRSQTVTVTLPVKTFAVSILTSPPGSSVLLDGKPVGITDISGGLILRAVSQGQHILAASHPGYPSLTRTLDVQDNSSFSLDLAAAGAQQQQQISESLERAKALFDAQQYDAAIAECNAILALAPNNEAATKLMQQIAQTKAILNAN